MLKHFLRLLELSASVFKRFDKCVLSVLRVVEHFLKHLLRMFFGASREFLFFSVPSVPSIGSVLSTA